MSVTQAQTGWKEDLARNVQNCMRTPDPAATINTFWGILWTHGILERIAPNDPEIIAERILAGKTVWESGRADIELYRRIADWAEDGIEKLKRDKTIEPASFVYGALIGFRVAIDDEATPGWMWTFLQRTPEHPIEAGVLKAMLNLSTQEIIKD